MQLVDKNILITGGAGFIGHHLVKSLSPKNSVYVIDNFKRGIPRRLDGVPGVQVLNLDITDLSKLLKIQNKIDVCIHLAAINGTKNFYERPIEVMNVGVKGVINILEFCSTKGIDKVVVASSAEVYQRPKVIPTPEDIELIVPTHTNPRYSYGLSKIFTEFYSLHYGNNNENLSVSIFRPHNVFGEDMGYKHVIPEFILPFVKAKLEKKSTVLIETKGPIYSSRAFCYVSDIIDGIEIISQNNNRGVYNIGNPVSKKITDILETLSEITGLDVEIDDSSNEHSGSVSERVPDIHKIQNLGFSPKVSFFDGLERTYKWYEKNYHLYEQERVNEYL